MNIVTALSLLYMLAVGVALAAAVAWRAVAREGREGAALSAPTLAVLAVVAAWAVARGGSKIKFDSFLADAGSYATNSVLHVAATNASAYAMVDFTASQLLVYARQIGLTNAADWVELLPRRTFGDLPADWTRANATNYSYLVYLDYVPPAPDVVDGVLTVGGVELPGGDAPLRAGFAGTGVEPKYALPYDAEVEYIRTDPAVVTRGGNNSSDRKQWLEFDHPVDDYTTLEVKFRLFSVEGQTGIAGQKPNPSNANNLSIYVNDTATSGGKLATSWRTGDWLATSVTAVRDTDYTVRVSGPETGAVYVNGTRTNVRSTRTVFNAAKIVIFSGHQHPQMHANGRIYSVRAWQYDVLMRDFIPVRVGDVGCLYDRVTRQLIRNVSGDGEFLPGPDKN